MTPVMEREEMNHLKTEYNAPLEMDRRLFPSAAAHGMRSLYSVLFPLTRRKTYGSFVAHL